MMTMVAICVGLSGFALGMLAGAAAMHLLMTRFLVEHAERAWDLAWATKTAAEPMTAGISAALRKRLRREDDRGPSAEELNARGVVPSTVAVMPVIGGFGTPMRTEDISSGNSQATERR